MSSAAAEKKNFNDFVSFTSMDKINPEDFINPSNTIPLEDLDPIDAVLVKADVIKKVLEVPQKERHAWHVTVKRLRCLSFPEPDGIITEPTRPKALIIASYNPPTILSCISLPPELDPPSGIEILDELVKCIVSPRVPNWTPCRPDIITFDSQPIASMVSMTISEGFKIPTALLRMGLQLDVFINSFSKALVEKKVCQVTNMSMFPPMLATPNVNPIILRLFYRMARDFAYEKPWEAIPDSQTFRMEFEKSTAPNSIGSMIPTTAWVSITGFMGLLRRREALMKGQEIASIPLTRGIKVFFKRFDAEQRILPLKVTSPVTPPSPALAAPNILDLVCTNCSKKATEETQSKFIRCGACRDAYFCSSECQREGTSAHEAACKQKRVQPAISLAEAQSKRIQPGFWPEREISCLFVGNHEMPFIDAEFIENTEVTPYMSMDNPVPLCHNNGQLRRVAMDELVWLMRAMAAIMSFMKARPDRANERTPMMEVEELDLGPYFEPSSLVRPNRSEIKDPTVFERSKVIQHWTTVLMEPGKVKVRTDPIIEVEEAPKLSAMINQKKAAVKDANSYNGGPFVPSVYLTE